MTFIEPPKFKVGQKVRDKDSCAEWRRRYKCWIITAVEWKYGAWFYQCGPGFWTREENLERVGK